MRRADGPARGRLHVVALGLAVATLGAGCSTFDDPSTVKDLRILAVRAEPPEVILKATAISDPPATFALPPIALTPLVADPRGGGRPITVTVDACPNNPFAPTSPNNPNDPTGYPAGGARTTVGSALCDATPARIRLATDVDLATQPSIDAVLDPALVQAAFAHDLFPGPNGITYGGFELGMPIVFQLTVRAGDETALAIKRAIVWGHAVRDDQTPNTTPAIPSVTAYDRRDEATAEPLPGAVVPLDEGAPLPVPDHGVWIDPGPALAEPYVTAVIDRATGAVVPFDVAREKLSYTFYATAGTFSPLETSSEPPAGVTTTSRVHIESKYEPPPKAQRPADVTIWIVVRDERGGASWISRSLSVPAAGSGP